MEIEYSNEIRGAVYAYRFTDVEKTTIAESLKPVLKKLETKIERIRNNPRNEGQVRYQVQIDALNNEVKELQKIITEFSKQQS